MNNHTAKENQKHPVKEIGNSDKRGTRVTFTPDKEIFKEVTEFEYEILSNRMRELSFLNKGINNFNY
jgi:DNA gyrase subunit B